MFRAPRGWPPLALMLADIPATRAQIAQHLGITVRTLQRYIEAEQAPRAILLALFWETRWGRSLADTEAANWAAVSYRRATGLERENATLKRQLARLQALRTDGAANAPLWRVG